MSYRSTREVARMLGVNSSRLARAIWDDRLDPPTRAPNGSFLWTAEDIQRASWLLRSRSADDVLSNGKGQDVQGVYRD